VEFHFKCFLKELHQFCVATVLLMCC
jgi:hypothetical protein